VRPKPVHYAKRTDFIAVHGARVVFTSSYAGRALCSFAKQEPTDAPITCKRCALLLVKYGAETATALSLGFTIEKERAFVYGSAAETARSDSEPAPQKADR
jgi:hypothetical protein